MSARATVTVEHIPPIEREEAMRLAEAEYGRFLDVLRSLGPDDWSKPTDCELWDVRLLVAHVLANAEASGSLVEGVRQQLATRRAAKREGLADIDAMGAVQVRAREHLVPAELVARLDRSAARSVRGRSRMPRLVRNIKINFPPPISERRPLSYLMDIILVRDVWMHRVDVSRAIDRPMTLAPDHDGRIVSDVVAEWARRHGKPFTLDLEGPAGGTFIHGGGGEEYRLDTVEFCRILSGRASGTGLLTTEVPF